MPPRRAPSPLRSVSGERPASGSRLRAPPSPSAVMHGIVLSRSFSQHKHNHTYIHTYRQTDRQTDRQTRFTHTATQAHTDCCWSGSRHRHFGVMCSIHPRSRRNQTPHKVCTSEIILILNDLPDHAIIFPSPLCLPPSFSLCGTGGVGVIILFLSRW
jgi:hypothetical protein